MAYWYCVCSEVGSVPVCSGEERAGPKGEALDLMVNLRSYLHLG